MFGDIPRNVWGHSLECLRTFPRMFNSIPWNVWLHSPECLMIIPGMLQDNPRNVWVHSPEYLATFSGMFNNIPRTVWLHSPDCLATFPGMFDDIPRNVGRHSPEYNIPPIPRVPHIPFPVPVFLVLYLANRAVFIQDQKVKKKFQISWEEKQLLRWNKRLYLQDFQLLKTVSDLRVYL